MPEIMLPAFPLSAVRAAGLFRIPAPTVEDVLPIVEHASVFTAAVLRVANSAASASMNEVRPPKVAVMRIVARHARRMVLDMAVSRAFVDLGRSGIDTDALWLHLCTVALVADRLTFSQAQQGEAFTAGILHDIGRLAMA